ncbi:MAG: glycosyltransferase, partial [Candidatus Lindowbacteria bacterium]|nr:glycosyltransferase [Candidatus Lindowbacteria bacterium]
MKPYLAIDLRELKRKDTGIGRWTRNFLSVKKKYAARLNIVGFGATTPGVDVAVAAPRLGMSGLNLNLQLEQMEAGLWMSPYYKIPPGLKIPCIGTVHDTIPSRKFPGNVLFNNRLKYSLDHAKLIVTVSDAVRRELIEEYGVSEDRVILARNSVNDEFCSKPKRGDVKMLAGLGLKKGGYRLAVIDDRPHKNLDVLIKAFADDPETPFVIVGTKRTDLPAHFKTLSGLGDDVLKVLYRYTSLFFHPAFEEGFGLPALEAMASGAELILSDIPPMREIAGGAAIYVDPSDPQAWRQATQSVDGSVAKREMGEERTKMFRAERTYQHLWENINQLLSVPAKKPSIKVSRPLVLHVHTLPWVGGSGLNTFFSMKYLDQSKYRTGLACAPGGRLEEKVRQEGFPFYAVENLCAEVAPLNDLLVSGELVRLFRKLKPSIIHTHNSKAGFVGRLAAQFCPEAHVVHTVHGFSFHDEETMMRKTVFKNLEKLAFRWADAHASISPTLIDWAEREKIGTAQD